MNDPTLDFYNSNAEDYTAHEGGPNPRLFGFLDRCKPNGKILELGAGGGVDAVAILERGFELDPTDGSSELAMIASNRIGRPVRTMLFSELTAVGIYDGVYASASLTHVARSELVSVVAKIHRALSETGVVWASFKAGSREGSDALGRYYSYLSGDELRSIWQAAAPWRMIDTEVWLGGGFDLRPTDWIAITALR